MTKVLAVLFAGNYHHRFPRESFVTSLSVGLLEAGRSVLVIDASDRVESERVPARRLSTWARSEHGCGKLSDVFVSVDDAEALEGAVRGSSADRVVISAEAFENEAVRLADLVLAPCGSDLLLEAGLCAFVRRVLRGRAAAFSIVPWLTTAETISAAATKFEKEAEKHKKLAKDRPHLADYSAEPRYRRYAAIIRRELGRALPEVRPDESFRSARRAGRTVLETEPSGTGAVEVRRLVAAVEKKLNPGTRESAGQESKEPLKKPEAKATSRPEVAKLKPKSRAEVAKPKAKPKPKMRAEVAKPKPKAKPKREDRREPKKKARSGDPEPLRGKDTFTLTKECSARIRAAAYWTRGETKSSIVERAVRAEIDRMEQERGAPFKRLSKAQRVDRGRPIKKRA